MRIERPAREAENTPDRGGDKESIVRLCRYFSIVPIAALLICCVILPSTPDQPSAGTGSGGTGDWGLQPVVDLFEKPVATFSNAATWIVVALSRRLFSWLFLPLSAVLMYYSTRWLALLLLKLIPKPATGSGKITPLVVAAGSSAFALTMAIMFIYAASVV